MRRSDLIRLIKEELGLVILEQQGADRVRILAACAGFALKFVKGKENKQLPITIMDSKTATKGDRSNPKAKSSKPIKKTSATGATIISKVSIGGLGDASRQVTGRKIITKSNDMNLMLDALGQLLRYAKSGSGFVSKKNKFVKQIQGFAKKLTPEQIKKLAPMAKGSEVLTDSVDSVYFRSNREKSVNKNSDEQIGATGAETEDFMLSTHVKYLTGPLATFKAGQYAGIEEKVKSHHKKYEDSFGKDSLLGALRSMKLSTPDVNVFSTSQGEFKRKLDKAVEA